MERQRTGWKMVGIFWNYLPAQLIQRVVNHFYLQGKFIVELRLQLIDVALVVQNILNVRVQLVNSITVLCSVKA